eukprot:TRINITY_DN7527_c0_g1_i3.p1 TRINITY_DN7527_c0_g1~~TRINITY_DN7527_c0_g1_i3.p1  ORF type:complete len:232 (+),score=28.99 TRINITY_DN7527_c0_g1_i3:1197-1892(+)
MGKQGKGKGSGMPGAANWCLELRKAFTSSVTRMEERLKTPEDEDYTVLVGAPIPEHWITAEACDVVVQSLRKRGASEYKPAVDAFDIPPRKQFGHDRDEPFRWARYAVNARRQGLSSGGSASSASSISPSSSTGDRAWVEWLMTYDFAANGVDPSGADGEKVQDMDLAAALAAKVIHILDWFRRCDQLTGSEEASTLELRDHRGHCWTWQAESAARADLRPERGVSHQGNC